MPCHERRWLYQGMFVVLVILSAVALPGCTGDTEERLAAAEIAAAQAALDGAPTPVLNSNAPLTAAQIAAAQAALNAVAPVNTTAIGPASTTSLTSTQINEAQRTLESGG